MAVAGQEQPTALVAELDDLLGKLDEINGSSQLRV
jgi:hypothetical protein